MPQSLPKDVFNIKKYSPEEISEMRSRMKSSPRVCMLCQDGDPNVVGEMNCPVCPPIMREVFAELNPPSSEVDILASQDALVCFP